VAFLLGHSASLVDAMSRLALAAYDSRERVVVESRPRMSRRWLTTIAICGLTAAALAGSDGAERRPFRTLSMAGPVVDLQRTDALADVILNLCRTAGVRSVRLLGLAADLSGARTKDDLERLFREHFRQQPRDLKAVPGIDLPVCDGLIAVLADVTYLDALLTIQVTVRPAVGLIVEDRAACTVTPKAEFYLPYLVTAVRVRSADRTPDRYYGPLRAALAEYYGRFDGLTVKSADDELTWLRGPAEGDDASANGRVGRVTRPAPSAMELRGYYFAGGVRERLKALEARYQKHLCDLSDK
jgi:hypothetical protein